MKLLYTVVGALALLPRVALAHFILLEPPTWNSQNSVGNPQKTGPCGSEGGTPTGTVTRFRAGETITVRWRETIYHPGHWRIAFAENRADLVDPIVTLDNNQNAVSATIVDPPVAPILMDNLFPVSGSGSNRTLQQQVTLPNRACAHCTLQVMQFMEGHGPPNYLYYHCADIELVMDTPDAGAVPVSDAGTISDAAFPNDGGFVIPDSGVAPQDTGVVAADSGVAEIDGGAEPVDSGAAAIDSGAAAVDTGAAAVGGRQRRGGGRQRHGCGGGQWRRRSARRPQHRLRLCARRAVGGARSLRPGPGGPAAGAAAGPAAVIRSIGATKPRALARNLVDAADFLRLS